MRASAFQSPMGISMISNPAEHTSLLPVIQFQSPMGISMISNCSAGYTHLTTLVSIPNGDKHDFKRSTELRYFRFRRVSIPNGDKHDFKQSSGGIGVALGSVSIPNGDKHDFKHFGVS